MLDYTEDTSLRYFVNNLNVLGKEIREFGEERDWMSGYTPRTLALALFAEMGELAELWRAKGDDNFSGKPWSQADKEYLGQEIADVTIYLIHLARVFSIDLKNELSGDVTPKK